MKKIIALILTITICFSFCACGNKDKSKQSQNNSNNSAVNNIYLSKSEVNLGIGETIDLIATVSPSNVDVVLTWSSSNSQVAQVNNQGTITAISEGDAVIKAEAPNGVLAVCNVNVATKTGRVTGNVTYKYNSYIGHKPDTDSKVFLISKSVKSLPSSVALGGTYSLPTGCYATKVDGSGNYSFDNIPVGDYYIVILSDNTNSGSDNGAIYWGIAVYNMFDESAKSTADNTCYLHKIKSTSITVRDGQTTTFSHDFGITYI